MTERARIQTIILNCMLTLKSDTHQKKDWPYRVGLLERLHSICEFLMKLFLMKQIQ